MIVLHKELQKNLLNDLIGKNKSNIQNKKEKHFWLGAGKPVVKT